MERLTDWINEEKTEVSIRHDRFRDAMIRLAAYEDTGLEPCEIPVLLDRLKRASEQWDIWCDAYQKDVPVWIPVAERIPAENEYRVVCAAHSGKPFLRRFEVAYITDTVGYQFGYYDGYKWIDKSNKEIPNVVAWKNHEPFNLKRYLNGTALASS